MNHIEIKSKKDCCGCTACYSACPKGAIAMCEDEEGFKYPSVDMGKCVDCGICVKKCPVIVGNQNGKTDSFFAVKNLCEDTRKESTSGGIFSAMAKIVTDMGGAVYGAAFDEEFAVRHIRADEKDIEKLRSSKYVQSDMGDSFASVKNDLKAGLPVLFSGTPCQVDGLNNYLKGTDTSKLVTCDLVCHGVPSPGIWEEYLRYLTKKTKKDIGKINFRSKTNGGWHDSRMKIEAADGTVLVEEAQNSAFFNRMYFDHLIIRPACYSCGYANLNRGGDITIGDFWGIEKCHPEFDDDKGISLVMVNTEKGRALFEKAAEKCTIIPVTEEECMQPNLKAPAKAYGNSELFWKSYRKYGLEFAGKRMGYLKRSPMDKGLVFAVRVFEKIGRLIHRG